MFRIYYVIICVFAICNFANAQSTEAARYEIDVKRYGLRYNSREALIRSREFIRLDPTYYVGYLYEGVYKYEFASDFLGFKNCIPPLKKSIDLLEGEFSTKLTAHYNSIQEYEPLHFVQSDYQMLVTCLMQAYSNLEYPDSVMHLLERYKSWNLQRDALGADNYIAWTIHRNRFYTKEKYDFLENSIKENDQKALYYLHNNLAEINRKAYLNEQIFSELAIEGDRLSAYHYLAMIHEYEHNMDSAMYYFKKMEFYNIFPYNNFATFLFVNGDFATSDDFFKISRLHESGDKRLQEADIYYMTMAIFKGNPAEGIKYVSEIVRQNGSSAGWGWYNIALARGFLYNGQTEKAEQHLTKAKNFKELHIGTTWGQTHYDTTIKFLQTMIAQRKIAEQKFENRTYWFSLKSLANISNYKLKFLFNQLVLLNQLVANPERQEVFFRVFASECTVTFDEILQTLSDAFENKYFMRLYEKFVDTDTRSLIKKYLRFYLANIYSQRGDKAKALQLADKIQTIEYIDDEYEVLLTARLYELYARISDTEEKRNENLMKFYSVYPQLVPYSGLQMNFRFEVKSDGTNKTENAVLKKLEAYNFNIVGMQESNTPKAKISFTGNETTDIVEFEVTDPAGKTITPLTKIAYDNIDIAARKLAYGLFNIIEPVLTTNAIKPPR